MMQIETIMTTDWMQREHTLAPRIYLPMYNII